MAMRWIISLLVAVHLAAAPARAEITWIDSPGAYELKAAVLFKLRSELPPELNESLKSIRNVQFEDGAAFAAALDAALLTAELRDAWTARLTELATQPGASYGIEPADGMLTIYVTDIDHTLDSNAFTAASWLSKLPEVGTSAFSATLGEGCLEVSGHEVRLLFRLCQPATSGDEKSVAIEAEAMHVVGLGQEFQIPGDTTAERSGFIRGGANLMGGFNGGANGNTLFPIGYFDQPNPFALILDNRYPQQWDLEATARRLSVKGGDLRLRVLAADTLADIRRQYMELSGHPPVPPKAMFGLWISEYGYENWGELDSKIGSLKAAGFPLSGAVLDLYWFGGIEPNSIASPMGGLNWDRTNFPDPEGKIAAYAKEGIGLMLIEESYISSALPEYLGMAEIGGVAHNDAGLPILTNSAGNWWGKGGMIDWLATDAAAQWHDRKRQPLIDMGITAHWTDLGEPEMVAPGFRYTRDNLTDPQVRNSYNLAWAQSIFDGYQRNSPRKRPFIMSRSGGMGLQALGGAMWSGDTGGDFGSLAAQMPQQQHMMWSGMDYYGSDIGGFHHSAMGIYPGTHEELTNELYTQWFAYSALFEVPVRPHTENLCNCKETAPDRIGDVASNLANIKLRYALEPYYYSLAHRAWLDGEPVFPSLDYYYDDVPAKGLGQEKMIGRELVSAAVATPGAQDVSIYLPAGDWYDLRSGTITKSTGETFSIPVHVDGRFQLPLFATDGAIIPMADGVPRLFGSAPNSFDWYDDDGTSTAYQRGEYDHVAFTIDGARVTLTRERGHLAVPALQWTRNAPVSDVLIDGASVPFGKNGNTITVTLPEFDESLTVEVL
jgi:alpha-glucosidase (family GH31 glycosyl hydrolase)